MIDWGKYHHHVGLEGITKSFQEKCDERGKDGQTICNIYILSKIGDGHAVACETIVEFVVVPHVMDSLWHSLVCDEGVSMTCESQNHRVKCSVRIDLETPVSVLCAILSYVESFGESIPIAKKRGSRFEDAELV